MEVTERASEPSGLREVVSPHLILAISPLNSFSMAISRLSVEGELTFS